MKHKDEILVPMTLKQHGYFLKTYEEIEKLKSQLRHSEDKVKSLERDLKAEKYILESFMKAGKEKLDMKINITINDKRHDYWSYRPNYENPFLRHIEVKTSIDPTLIIENLVRRTVNKEYLRIPDYHMSNDRHRYEHFLDPIRKTIDDNVSEPIKIGLKEIDENLGKMNGELNDKLELIPKWIRKIFGAL